MVGWLQNLLPDLRDVLVRFSIAVLAALLTCLYLVNISSDMFSGGSVYLLTGSAAFLAAGAGHLLAEGRGTSRGVNIAIALVFAAAAGALEYDYDVFHTSALFLFAALVLGLMVAPFLRHGVEQGAVWLFSLRLGMAALLALIVGLVFAGGISAIMAGLDFLLGFHIDNQIYQKVWTIAVTFVGPVYGLSLVPRDLDAVINIEAHRGDLLERGVSVLVNYVMVPLAVIYALILHAYAAKTAFLGSLPKGEIGLIVSLFAVGGTATWLIGWPWREKGTALLKLFMRGWFWLLPIPVLLLLMAIWRRLSDYGVTPDRYGIALVAVWAVLVFGYLVWWRNRADLRAIIASAAALFLFASFGPQGANGLTASSQFGRLQALLERLGVLK
ncbi:MAG: DUF4153 domain-containing protein, partial [Alphaproteobacteria bacterium]|nr:DUF4153 domain-containing protein [Alphaproteobacteria bacterium]